jgi:hypothetical protein
VVSRRPNQPAHSCALALLIAVPLDVALIVIAIAHPLWLLMGLGGVVLVLIVLGLTRRS